MGNMTERRDEERLRKLMDDIDVRLRDAERLRNHADERQRRGAFYPERRHSGRIPDVSPRDRDNKS
jgi:hypothetical protein